MEKLNATIVYRPAMGQSKKNGKQYALFSLYITDGNDAYIMKACAWGDLAEEVVSGLRPGSEVVVMGRTKKRSWTRGVRTYTEDVFVADEVYRPVKSHSKSTCIKGIPGQRKATENVSYART